MSEIVTFVGGLEEVGDPMLCSGDEGGLFAAILAGDLPTENITLNL